MRELAEKLATLERTLAQEKGPFDLFALFLRENAPGVWDLVVAAQWIERDADKALPEISERVRRHLTSKEIAKIARVVVVERTHPALKAITSAIAIEHGIAEVTNSNFFGLAIKHAFIIVARRDSPPNTALNPTVGRGRPPAG